MIDEFNFGSYCYRPALPVVDGDRLLYLRAWRL